MYTPYKIPAPTFKVMSVLSNFVWTHKEPIGHQTLAKLCDTTDLALISIVKRIGRDAVALGIPFLDAWVVNEETRKPNEKFLLQKIELGYTEGGVDFDEFWRAERERFWNY